MDNDSFETPVESAVELSLNGEWRLDYFPQPDDGAVRALPLKVPFRSSVAAFSASALK